MISGPCRLFLATVVVAAACKGPPARLVAGIADTVIVNDQRAVQLPMRVLDAAGHPLASDSVRYRWVAGIPVSVSATGVATCTQSGEATVRAVLGSLTTHMTVQCRPVREMRGSGMLNLVVGDSAQDLPFEAVGLDDRPVTLLTARISIDDSTIATLQGSRIRARAPGSTSVTIRVGSQRAYWSLHSYERVRSPEGILSGQHLAVPVRLEDGEARRWRIPAGPYFLTMLPAGAARQMPRLTIIGANCEPAFDEHSFFCIAQHEASAIVDRPRQTDPTRRLTGTLAVWRKETDY